MDIYPVVCFKVDDNDSINCESLSGLEPSQDVNIETTGSSNSHNSESYKNKTCFQLLKEENTAVRVGCLYRVLAVGMFGNESQHSYIRQHLVSNIVNNWQHYKELVSQNRSTYSFEISDSNDYRRYMSIDGRQGGELELHVATMIFNIYVDLVDSHAETVKRFGTSVGDKRRIVIYFTPAHIDIPCCYRIVLDKKIIKFIDVFREKSYCINDKNRKSKQTVKEKKMIIQRKNMNNKSKNSILYKALMKKTNKNIEIDEKELYYNIPLLDNFGFNDYDPASTVQNKYTIKKYLLKRIKSSPLNKTKASNSKTNPTINKNQDIQYVLKNKNVKSFVQNNIKSRKRIYIKINSDMIPLIPQNQKVQINESSDKEINNSKSSNLFELLRTNLLPT